MISIKCNVCGADVEIREERTVGLCESCGCVTTLPRDLDEQRAARFNLGSEYRRRGAFDKALAVYASLVREDETDAEAHWCCALSRFGVVYEEDPNTLEYRPVCRRAVFDPFPEDPDCAAALANAAGVARLLYRREAARIVEARRGIRAGAGNEQPFEVFLCYQQTGGRARTQDDELEAGKLLEQLTRAGYRPYLSGITPEHVTGSDVEPYLLAALKSAKVVVNIGEKPGRGSAANVRNELGRLLHLVVRSGREAGPPAEAGRDVCVMPRAFAKLRVQELVSAGAMHTVGVLADGRVVAVGNHDSGQCDVSEWTDVAAVSAGKKHTVGLRTDGTVLAAGYAGARDPERSPCAVSSWSEILAISAGPGHTVGLKADGTATAVGSNESGACEVSGWKDLIAISAGLAHTVGLKADGTVVATTFTGDPKLDFGQCAVSDWTDIAAVSAGWSHTVGLKKDGTVVATEIAAGGAGSSKLNYGQCQVSAWREIAAVSAGAYHTVGLKTDGTVVAVGRNINAQCEVSGWTEIVAVSAGEYHTVGLKADGTLVTAGSNAYGCSDVSDWRLFRRYETADQERREAAERAERERLDAERAVQERLTAVRRRKEAVELRRQESRKRITALQQRLQEDREELASLRGLFSGMRREELEDEIERLNSYITNLQKQLSEP